MAIVAPQGSPLAAAVIGVANLEESLQFYRDMIGMQVLHETTCRGADYERYWHLPAGAGARAALLSASDDLVGRVLLLEFDVADRLPVRAPGVTRAVGLFNLNFYSADIHADAERFRAAGFHFWSDPVAYDLGADVGSPIEVVFDGPDGVAINLVELATGDMNTRIGQMRAYVASHGRTPRGFTPVVTSSHVAQDIDKARAFYEQVLHMGVLIDDVLQTPASNRLLGLDPDSRTHVVFMQGNHMFGKIAVSQPLNYDCDSLIAAAAPPNIGYLAQQFVVADAAIAAETCARLEVEIFTPLTELELPGLGRCATMLIRNPGSGALQEIAQPL
ncbi:MAG: VOC family protein [Gammaproteobacteria bacterium]|nr:VOC family protein [Gammaproteobacteria bacterium]